MEKKKDNKKNTKIIIIIAIIAVVLLGGTVLTVLLLGKAKNNNGDNTTTTTTIAADEVVVTFNTNGGDSIEPMTVKKGEVITLPIATYEGHIFKWWADDQETIYNETCTIEENTTLTAIWEEIPAGAKTMKISFDSKGGSSVRAITLVCENNAATIKSLPKNPTKGGYTFRAWEDKNGKAILKGAKLTCEDLTLYAAYDENSTSNNKTVNTTCPEGEQEGNNCVITVNAKISCPNNMKYSEKADKCYTITANPTITCKAAHGFDSGTKYDDKIGHKGCVYQDLSSYPEQQVCAQHGGIYQSYFPNGHCWKYNEPGESHFVYNCPNGTKYTGASELGNTANMGCYTIQDKAYKCEDGFQLNGNKCTKTVPLN